MKKVFIITIILIIFSIASIKSKSEYNYLLKENSYNLYKIKIKNLNTKNINNYIDKVNIKKIYPKINPIYKEKIGNIAYQINSSNMKLEIDEFKRKYLNIIKKNNYSDYNYLYANGIDIEAIEVYMNSKDLYYFLNSNDANVVDKKGH
ncbi:MAG: hypothetical protein J6D28_00085 [Bacilli bacterium]|nr:hypothetical protein [Bacilli bacterium]